MKKLREIWLKRAIRKAAKIGKSRTILWEKVNHMGIMLLLKDEKTYRELIEMQDHLEQENPNLRIHFLFYLQQKNTPDYLVAGPQNFLLKKQLSWSGVPKAGTIDEWMTKELQVLINASPQLPDLGVIFKKTPASLRVSFSSGAYASDADIVVGANDTPNIREKIETAVYYLKMMKPSR